MPTIFDTSSLVNNLTSVVADRVISEVQSIISEYNLERRDGNLPQPHHRALSISEKNMSNYYSIKYVEKTPEQSASETWSYIMSRCYNENNISYVYYGGHNIYVCDDFKNKNRFIEYCLLNLGPKPKPYYVIDRIDNNCGYEPGNIRWAHPKVSGCNKNNCIVQEFHRYVASCLYKYYNIKQAEILNIFINKNWILRQPRTLLASFSAIIRSELINV